MAFGAGGIGTGGLNSGSGKALDKFIPEVWADAIKNYFPRKMVLGNLAVDWSSEVAGGGDLIHFPAVNEVSTGTKSAHTAISWAANTTDEGEYTLAVDQHSYAGILIEDVAKVQSSYDLFDKYTNELSYAVAKKIESYLSNKMDDETTNTIELSGTSTDQGLAKADIETLIKTLLEADLDPIAGDVYLCLKPETYASLFSLDDFARADVIGDSFNYPRVSGFIGQLAGLPVYVSNFVGEGDATGKDTVGWLWHKSALNVAYSQFPRVQSDYDIDYLGSKVVVDMIYGCKVINSSTSNNKRMWRLTSES